MTSLLNGIRGTVQGVIGATDHVLWWLGWHTGAECARTPKA
jgi:hypothetical protein